MKDQAQINIVTDIGSNVIGRQRTVTREYQSWELPFRFRLLFRFMPAKKLQKWNQLKY